MASDEKDDKWGTIFIDSKRESTLGQLDAMQAASRQEQWNQRTQQDYLEKVRAKAIDKAREILGDAYTERQKVLEEAELEASNIRAEALAVKNNAESIRNEAQELRHNVQAELDKALHMQSTAQEDGFQAGLTQAQEELEKFRLAMGSSVAGVLKAIEDQSLNIFAAWRAELVSLLKVCVEKSTALAIDERYNKILEQLVIEAVRQLDDRRHVTLRVHPDDEPVMTDIFSAAKEKLPDLGQWAIEPDQNLELGGLVAESASGTVDSRLELFREMVDNILEHLVLPEGLTDAAGVEFVKKISRLEKENVEQIVPPVEEPTAQVEPLETTEPVETTETTETSEATELAGQEPSVDTAQADMIDSAQSTTEQGSEVENITQTFEPELAGLEHEHAKATNSPPEDIAPTKTADMIETDMATEAEQLSQVDDTATSQELSPEQKVKVTQELSQNSEQTKELSRLELEEELLPLPQNELEEDTSEDSLATTLEEGKDI